MIRRQGHFLGTVPEFFGGDGGMEATFVADGNIKYGKEGLIRTPVFVMRFSAAFIPHKLQIDGTGIVIGLAVVGAVVTFVFKELGIKPDRLRLQVGTPHLFVPVGAGMYTGNYGVPGWCAYRGVGIGIGIQESFASQLIQIRCSGKIIPVTPKQGAVVLAGDPEDVG
jgi:hypothetical protein